MGLSITSFASFCPNSSISKHFTISFFVVELSLELLQLSLIVRMHQEAYLPCSLLSSDVYNEYDFNFQTLIA